MRDFEQSALNQASDMISKFGQLVIWQQTRDGVPADTDKPWEVGPATTVEFPVYICFLPANRKLFAALMYQAGTDIPTGFVRGLMTGNVPFVPALKDSLVREGVVYSVEYIEVFNPAGNALLYTLGLLP